MSITVIGAKELKLVFIRATKGVVQVAVPIELGHASFYAQVAQMCESHLEIVVFGFQPLESVKEDEKLCFI